MSAIQGQISISATTPLEFEVVSIKPRKVGSPGGSRSERLPGGRRILENVLLRGVLMVAYPTKVDLVGAPDWVTSDRFDITALPPFAPTDDQERMMLRAMLADRFKLKVHYETEERAIYNLVVAREDRKLGPQIHATDIDCASYKSDPSASSNIQTAIDPPPCSFRIFAHDSVTIVSGGRKIEALVNALTPLVGRPIFDKTGLNGDYAFSLNSFVPNTFGPNDGVSVFAALQEQLGLRLESSRGPVEVVIIDHIEKPTPD
jgi:uncharacterized protein (TIGR03435 family)